MVRIEALCVGKYKSDPSRNDDTYMATQDTFAVIDGSAQRTGILFNGKSSGQFAAEVLKEVLQTTPAHVNCEELVALMTKRLNDRLDKIGAGKIIEQTPESRPAALFVSARITKDKLVVTALGDVRFRMNGRIVHKLSIKTEEMMVKKRISAMKKDKRDNPNISVSRLIEVGRRAIQNDLSEQVKQYFNKDIPLGIGIIDGNPVPERFIKVYEFDLDEVEVVELFSDGYYVMPNKPSIQAWEEAFHKAEKDDPLRWKKYPAVKYSTANQFSDDRTILIANFFHPWGGLA